MPSIKEFVAQSDALARIDPDLKVHYSQFGEDLVVIHAFEKFFAKNDPGFYIDVGAHHPKEYSTTAILHCHGWRGINIDVSERAIELLKSARPDDISILAGVAKTQQRRPYYLFDPAAVSTLDPATRDEWLENGWVLKQTKEVAVYPLSEIVSPHLSETQKVDYLNIDIEGLDLEALETYDFEHYAPSVITIELHNFNLLEARHHPVVKFLINRGYKLHSYIAITAVFIRI
jgi:FkbM family methyltransferase